MLYRPLISIDYTVISHIYRRPYYNIMLCNTHRKSHDVVMAGGGGVCRWNYRFRVSRVQHLYLTVYYGQTGARAPHEFPTETMTYEGLTRSIPLEGFSPTKNNRGTITPQLRLIDLTMTALEFHYHCRYYHFDHY